MSCVNAPQIDTHCIRCQSDNTLHWRVDHNGHLKFYCESDWKDWLNDRILLERCQ